MMTYTCSHLQDADFEQYDLAFLRRFSIGFVCMCSGYCYCSGSLHSDEYYWYAFPAVARMQMNLPPPRPSNVGTLNPPIPSNQCMVASPD